MVYRSEIHKLYLLLVWKFFQIDKKTGKPKVWIYKDKMTGRPKGEATVTYDDPETAKAAINWFSGEFLLLIRAKEYADSGYLIVWHSRIANSVSDCQLLNFFF